MWVRGGLTLLELSGGRIFSSVKQGTRIWGKNFFRDLRGMWSFFLKGRGVMSAQRGAILLACVKSEGAKIIDHVSQTDAYLPVKNDSSLISYAIGIYCRLIKPVHICTDTFNKHWLNMFSVATPHTKYMSSK